MPAQTLFDPIRVGDLQLSNRIVMAPLTRHRADPETLAPYALNAIYYAQRASAGLIVSEASQISQEGQGYINTPGIYSERQIAGWKGVTDAVHWSGGVIVCQLWHVGRVSHVSLQPGGGQPVAPSAIASTDRIYIHSGFVQPSMPRALRDDEIPRIVGDYARAAENAKKAGFDGVEIHGANGYLLDQFMRDGSNRGTGRYGGEVENRIRLTLEVVDTAVAVWGRGRVGIRIAPTSSENSMFDTDPQKLFGALVAELGRRSIAYVHAIEGTADGTREVEQFDYRGMRRIFPGALILNNGYTSSMAETAIAEGRCDLVSFGRPFISNPDLVSRLRVGAALSRVDEATVYGGDEHGYTDYATLASSACVNSPISN
jgi:N-ethylmaleimide reductase